MPRCHYFLLLLPVLLCGQIQAQFIDTLYYYQGAPTSSEKLSYGRMYACTKFSPIDYPVTVKAFEFLVTDISEGQTCTLNIFDDSAGEPGAWVYGPVLYEIEQTGWQRIDISAENIVFDYDFYIAVGYENPSSPRIACEYDEPYSLRTFDMDCCGWFLIENTDLFMRTLVEHFETAVQHELSNQETPLLQIFPNPFNQSLTVAFESRTAQPVQISIFDILGQRVTELRTAVVGPGRHEIRWDGKDESGSNLASGIYFLTIYDGQQFISEKITIMK